MRHGTLAIGFVAALGLSALLGSATVKGQGQTPASTPAPANTRTGHPQLQLMAGASQEGRTPSGTIAASGIGFGSTDNLDGGFFSNFPGGVFHHPRIFLIFWSPNGTIQPNFKNLLSRFSNDVGGTPFANILTQYYDNDLFSRDNITTDIQLADVFTDSTTAYNTYNGHAGTPADPLVDNDIQQEVSHAISVKGWPEGFDNFFAVFTEQGIESCADSSNCTPGTAHPVFCAYHSVFFDFLSPVFYANMPFVNTWGGCQGNVNGAPNFAAGDQEVSTFSHELYETITDPLTLGTWTDPDGLSGEIADKCNQHFDSPANADGSNLSLHGNLYNVQPEWSNGTANALGNGAFAGCTHQFKPDDMDVTKTGPSQVFAGASFDYDIDVSASGPITAETPHMKDNLTSHLQFIAIAKPSDWTCNTPPSGTTGNIDCFKTNGSAHLDGFMNDGDTASFTVTARVKPDTANGTMVSNTGTINWDTKYTQDKDQIANVQLSEGSLVTSEVLTLADLSISKSAQGAAVAGQDFSYVIDVENNGPSNAQSVEVNDPLPANTTLVSVSPSGGFICTGTTTIHCTLASMNAGGLASITVTVHISPAATGTLTNTVTVASPTNDPNPSNNSDTVSSSINTESDLSITKTGPSAPTAGSDVVYTIKATNLGPSNAQNVHITDTIPANTTFVSVTPPAGWTCNAASPVDCTRATFGAGNTATFILTVHLSAAATSGDQLCNTASVSTTTTDPVSSNNASTGCGTIQTLADLVLTQTGSRSGSNGNGIVTFVLTVHNNGPSDSQNVNLVATSDLFTGPPPSINVANGGTCSVANSHVTCTWASLPLGASSVVSITVPWKSSVGSVCDSASLTAGTPDPNATNNTSAVCVDKNKK
jgi:uncharacterized repeat protein (TIGR01451 family)